MCYWIDKIYRTSQAKMLTFPETAFVMFLFINIVWWLCQKIRAIQKISSPPGGNTYTLACIWALPATLQCSHAVWNTEHLWWWSLLTRYMTNVPPFGCLSSQLLMYILSRGFRLSSIVLAISIFKISHKPWVQCIDITATVLCPNKLLYSDVHVHCICIHTLLLDIKA